jgi:hypothetical protein
LKLSQAMPSFTCAVATFGSSAMMRSSLVFATSTAGPHRPQPQCPALT